MIEWFDVYNEATFLDEDLVSKSVTVDMGTRGDQTVVIFRGNFTSLLFDGVFLCADMNDRNPFHFADHLIYIDDDDEIWLGIVTDEN